MNVRSLWISLAGLACLATLPGVSYAQDAYAGAESETYARQAQPGVAPGHWLWSLSDDPLLRRGATAVTVADGAPETVYIGGLESVIVSHDGGRTFMPSLQFGSNAESDPIAFFQNDPTLVTRRAEAIREYLRENLEEQFDSRYVDSLLDEITDDDLLEASEVTDLEPLRNLALDMDNDLRNAPVEIETPSTVTNLSNFDSFIRRYKLAQSVKDDMAESAVAAAQSRGVWQIRAIGQAAYAVTPSTIYMTTDSGNSWQALIQAAEGESFLSIDVTPDFRQIIIGATNGFILSQDGATSWARTGSDIIDAVYDVRFSASNDIWALTTRGIVTTAPLQNLTDPHNLPGNPTSSGAEADAEDDAGTNATSETPTADNAGSAIYQWKRIPAPVRQSETALRICPGDAGNILLLTDESIYTTRDFIQWFALGTDVLNDAYIRDIYVRDNTLTSFIVLTDSQVLAYDNGWINQSNGLKQTKNAHIVPLPDQNRLALITAENGIYFAYDSKRIEQERAYIELKEQWSREPSYAEIIQAAFEAHNVGDNTNRRWRLRSRLAWLLPNITAQYTHRQKIDDYHKYVKTEKNTGAMTGVETFSYKRETQNHWQVRALWDLRIERSFKDDFNADRVEDYLETQYLIAQEVISALDERHSLQINRVIQQIESGAPGLFDEINAQLAMQEVEATLHYLTGGFYLPALRSRR